VILGKDDVVRAAVTCFVAGGHLLVEDVPGVGKTTLARALAKAVGGSFRRIQFTSDLLPTDILGVGVFDQTAREFCFHPGPIFANVVLADEINRATPKTQSALLEAMSDRQVTAEGQTRPLPEPFLVVATQNPSRSSAPTRCPSPSSIASSCASSWATPPPRPSSSSWPAIPTRTPCARSPSSAPAPISSRCSGPSPASASRTPCCPTCTPWSNAPARAGRSPSAPRPAAPCRSSSRPRRALAEARDYCVPDDVQRCFLPVLAHRLHPPGGMPEDGRAYAEDALRRILASVPVPT